MCGDQGTGTAVCDSVCPIVPQMGTGANKKGTCPQQYGEGPERRACRAKARRNNESSIGAEALMDNAS